MTMHQVQFQVTLDTDAIRAAYSLQEWAGMLNIEISIESPLTWEHIFSEIGRSVIGSHQYRKYCWTAIDDQTRFRPYVLGQADAVKVYSPPKTTTARKAVRAPRQRAALEAAPTTTK